MIFLVNHRFTFYWYVPFLGLAGLAGLVVRWMGALARSRVPFRTVVPAGIVLFAALSVGYFWYQLRITRPGREFMGQTCQDHNGFLAGMRAFQDVPSGATLYFNSMPRTFSEDVLKSAVQVALHRTDVKARLVQVFPPEAKYRLRFENSRVVTDPRF